MVHEIKNLCRNNQMRDVFFEEVECDDPETYVRGLLKGKVLELSREEGADGQVTIHAVCDGLIRKLSGVSPPVRLLTSAGIGSPNTNLPP